MTEMPPDLGRRGLSERRKRSTQQAETHGTYENKGLVCGILGGKVVSTYIIGSLPNLARLSVGSDR